MLDRRRLAVSAALAIVALLVLVALASRSGTLFGDSGSGGPRPSDGVVDYVFTFGLALFAVLMAATLWTMRPSARFKQERSFSLWPSFVAAAIVFGAIAIALTQLDDLDFGRGSETEAQQAARPPRVEPAQGGPTPNRDGNEASVRWPAVLVLAGVAAAATAGLLGRRTLMRRRGTLPPTSARELLAELTATIDEAFFDLEAEPDPRRAVIAAYARMERALAAHGLGRLASEAPLEYLARIAPSLSAARRLVFELTHLYEQARFSAHEIDGEMKAGAISTLAELRDELRLAA